MRSEFKLDGMRSANAQIAKDLRARSLKAVEVGGEGLKQDLREMTGRALGDRLAKTWRLNIYGADGSQSPAAFIWTKAPRIIEGNMTGGRTVPVAGSEFLALPTRSVPRRRGRGGKSRMSPEEVESHFNQDLIIRPGKRPGTLLGFVEVVRTRSTRRPGFRQATRGRLAQGRQAKLILMFTFVRSVRRDKTIDPQAAFARWRRRTRQMLQNGV